MVQSLTYGLPSAQAMRIAIVTETYPPEVNGVALTVARAAGYLRGRGYEIELVRPRQAADGIATAPDTVLVAGAPIPFYNGLRFGLPASGKLSRRWRNPTSRPDLVHVATEGPLGWAAVSAASRLGIPATSDFRTNFHQYGKHYGLGALEGTIGAYLRAFHNRTRRTFVPTRAVQGVLATEGYENVVVSGRGVDTETFAPEHRDPFLRQRWRVRDGDLVVLYAGRLAPEKNLSLVSKTFVALKAADPHAKLVFVGDGPLHARLAAQCPDAIFAGVQKGEALAAHYASADLFVFPSLTETFGNVTLEALASGLAVVAFDQAAAGVHIADGVNGKLAPSNDPDRFIDAALEIAGNADARARMRRAARQSALKLKWEVVLADFERELLSVIESQERVDERTCLV